MNESDTVRSDDLAQGRSHGLDEFAFFVRQ